MRHHVPQLTGVRGLAVLIVILHNSVSKFPSLPLQSLFGYGWMGVDLFFVLSGFLITGILVDSKQSENYFKNFYARRCLRILPLYYSVVAFMFLLVPLLGRHSLGPAVFAKSSPWWAYPFFLQNFLVHPPTGAVGPLGVTWSVAIEEQFYLVWALVVRSCSSARLKFIAAAVICLSPVLRVYLSIQGVDLYTNVFCRLDGLMAGALLALVVRSSSFLPARYVSTAWIAIGIGAPLAMVTDSIHLRWITFSLSALVSAAFVYLALFATQKRFIGMLSSRWLVFTGTISYGLYLLHKIPFDAAQYIRVGAFPYLTLIAGMIASYVLATLSWNLLERPFLTLKKSFEPAPEAGKRDVCTTTAVRLADGQRGSSGNRNHTSGEFGKDVA